MRRALASILFVAGCGRGGAADRGDAAIEQPATTGTEPTDVQAEPERLRATAIAIGGATSYARMNDGSVRGWGDGRHFALGREDEAAVAHPIAIAGVEGATAVFAGGLEIATACATIEDGRVLCWGERRGFPLARELSIEGVPVTEVPALAGAREITIGTHFGCAVMSDATVRCWGRVPGWVERPISEHREPEPVPTLDGVISVRAGWAHVCALGEDGRVRCWGRNHPRQLVPGAREGEMVTAPVVVEGIEGAVEIAVAQDFAVARLGDGTLRVWSGEGVSTPALDGQAIGLSRSGGAHACAITDAGAVRCVGLNDYGQLGRPPQRGAVTALVEVPGLRDAVALAVGQTHSCALVRDGIAWCWGGNTRGGLGEGTLGDHHEPQLVAHLLDAEPPPPTPPKIVDDAPAESYEGIPEGCAHPTLAFTLPDRERTSFEVKSAYALITDDHMTAWIHLRDHGFDAGKTLSLEYPRGDRLHLELVLERKKFIREQRGDRTEWVTREAKLKPGLYRTFAAWLALDSPNDQPTVDLRLWSADGPILLEASPVRGDDIQDVTITRLGPDWVCGTLAISSPRGTVTGDFAARVRQ